MHNKPQSASYHSVVFCSLHRTGVDVEKSYTQ